jgi:hypothetical protein
MPNILSPTLIERFIASQPTNKLYRYKLTVQPVTQSQFQILSYRPKESTEEDSESLKCSSFILYFDNFNDFYFMTNRSKRLFLLYDESIKKIILTL